VALFALVLWSRLDPRTVDVAHPGSLAGGQRRQWSSGAGLCSHSGLDPGTVQVSGSEQPQNERMQQTKGRAPRNRPFAADPRCSPPWLGASCGAAFPMGRRWVA